MQHSKTRGGRQGLTGKLKTSGANHDNASLRSSGSRSPKAVDHRLQRAPTSEKKRVGRVSELEIQLAQLQEEFKKSKEQLNESESCKKRAHHQAEEAKKHLSAMSAKLQESQQQLDELWACEESRIQELRKISQDRDRAWESELKAVQKHHSMDTATLAAVINENQKLRIQLQKIGETEANQAKHGEEVQTLRLELSETLDLVEELKIQLNESKDSEARALELVSQTQEELDMVKSRDAGNLTEEEAVVAANAEMESEIRRLKVQMEQWRKAAEVAAAMALGNGGDGKFVESFDFQSNSSPYSEDTEDESSNKKTSNMLKKIGVLLKKGQK
ncbi:interactor of constitutive active ROPs 2, chloroplastic-like [Cynara cardunculus var. scolymus]|uniref:interactor of constitutive active ROPs 2, chloroplastic-like n=1 Tax=Cynara cardunculus var. scolymus TaxID=59895 RepID=UPI000D62C1AB|nr:interactor of constitutive active ROPs 2, chloroplastic-like [Cynara cardunculus var. scolymus]